MISGRVNDDLEAVINIRVRWRGPETSVDAIVDTGFSEFLTLPSELVQALDLEYFDLGAVKYADGRYDEAFVYHVRVFWNDEWRRCYVHESEGDILCGMRMLKNHSLAVVVRADGEVEIEATA